MRNSLALRIALGCLIAAAYVETARSAVVVLPKEERITFVEAEADGDNLALESSPTVIGFQVWNVSNRVERNLNTFAEAAAAVSTFLSPNTMVGGGGAGGQIGGAGSNGLIKAWSLTEFHFAVPDCQDYSLVGTLGASGDHNVGSAVFQLVAYDPLTLNRVNLFDDVVPGGGIDTTLDATGRLSGGTYLVRGRSDMGRITSRGIFTAPEYTFALSFSPCASDLISQHPVGGPMNLGATALLTVTAASGAAGGATGAGFADESPASSAGLTYQWRYAGVDLVDDARITGATSATLSIADFQIGDAGGYVVRVSDGVTEQTSSIAVLSLPEPGAAAMVATGVLALHAMAYRRRKLASSSSTLTPMAALRGE